MGSENLDRDHLETLSSELNDRISREINSLIGAVNVQVQRTVEEAICSQVLPQVQNILKEVQNRDVSGPKDHERPDPGSDCLGREKRDQIPKSSSNMAINCGENIPQSHYIQIAKIKF